MNPTWLLVVAVFLHSLFTWFMFQRIYRDGWRDGRGEGGGK
jgi:hypothetical protein